MASRRFDRIGWAMAQEGLTCPQKFVLVILADAADEVRGVCWLKHATIADRTSLGLTAVRGAIRALAEAGLLRVAGRSDKHGRQTSNYYQLGYYDAEEEIEWRVSPDDTLRADEGVATRQGGVSGDDTSIVNQPEGTGLQNSRKTSSSSARLRRGRDQGPDQSTLDEINREIRPGTSPAPAEETRRVTRRRKPRHDHIHQPLSNKADGLACYWAVGLERTGALPNRFEEQQIEKNFRSWLSMGLEPKTAREMIDAFFADPAMVDSEVPWARFVANAERLRKAMLKTMPKDEQAYAQVMNQRLPEWAREILEEDEATA